MQLSKLYFIMQHTFYRTKYIGIMWHGKLYFEIDMLVGWMKNKLLKNETYYPHFKGRKLLSSRSFLWYSIWGWGALQKDRVRPIIRQLLLQADNVSYQRLDYHEGVVRALWCKENNRLKGIQIKYIIRGFL
jgi:hypothetical protein